MVALMLLLLPVVSVGCGSPETEEEEPEVAEAVEPEEPKEEEEEPEEEPTDEQPVSVDQWRNPTGVDSLVPDFEVLEWTWTSYADGEETSSTDVSYRFEGTEQVGDKETIKIVLTFDDQEIVMWVDDDGEAVQTEIDGELLPDEVANMMVNPMLNAVFWPFIAARTFRVSDVVMGRGYGWDTQVVSTETRQVGDLQAEVTEIVVEVGPPHTEEGEEVEITWEIGDFGEFQMLLGWSTSEAAAGDANFDMKITRVVPR